MPPQAPRFVARGTRKTSRTRYSSPRQRRNDQALASCPTGSGSPPPRPWSTRNTISAWIDQFPVQRTLVQHVHANILAGRRGPELSAAARAQAEHAFALLERGLAGYGVKQR